MAITLPLEPQEEAELEAIAHAKGLSVEALVREALEGVLAQASEIPADARSGSASGALLVCAMQASPFKEMDLEAARY
jgi:hypothetical protein